MKCDCSPQLFVALPEPSSRWGSRRGTVLILPLPPAYQQNRRNVDSAMCLLFLGIRTRFPRLFFQNEYFGIESSTGTEPKIILGICVTTQNSKAQKFCFFSLSFPEVPLVLYLFALISMTWLWGGLHMAYRHFWMLVLFVIFNSLQVSLTVWLLMAHMYPKENMAWGFSIKKSSVQTVNSCTQ